MRTIQHWIGGEPVGGSVVGPVYDPATGEQRAQVGDTHIHGPEGVRFYTRAKAVTTRWPQSAEAASMSFPTAG